MHLCYTKACRTEHKVMRRLFQLGYRCDRQHTWVCLELENSGLTLLDAGEGIWILRLISSNVGGTQKWCQWYDPGLAEDKWKYLHSQSLQGQACFCLLLGIRCWCPSCVCPEVPLVILLLAAFWDLGNGKH